MSLMVIYIIIVFIGQAFAVTAGILLDGYSKAIGLAVFLVLYFAVFVFGWKLAVRLTGPGGMNHGRLDR